MRLNFWKLLGGAGLAGAVVAFWIVGRSSPVAGEPAQPDPSEPMPIAAPESGPHYELGPNPIPYEAQPAAEQDNIDTVYETLQANQPASSHQAFARAVDQTVIESQGQIAARHVGLEGVEEQGVVP